MRGMYLLTAASVLLVGCAIGPNYKRPKIDPPTQFRSAPAEASSATGTSIGDTRWSEVFQDEKLTDLIQLALAQNYDIRIASARVLEARARYGISRAELYPNLTASGSFTSQRQSSIGSIIFLPKGTPLAASYTSAGFNLNWELDLWGRIRRLNEAARAQYLATEDARNGVKTTLVGDVTTGYFNLRESDLELEIAKKTREVAERSLKLTTLRRDGGTATSLDVRQAEQFLYRRHPRLQRRNG